MTIEAIKDRIIVTDKSMAAIHEAINGLCRILTPAYADFTFPVRQADGQFVSTGHVRIQ